MKTGLFLLLIVCMLSACERAKQDMYDQPRYKPFAASPLWPDGASAREPPDGIQPYARGGDADSSGGRRGAAVVLNDIRAAQAQTNPYPVDLQLLRHGQNRYMVYCMPCHSPVGDGDGLVVRRGFPAPPSFHQARLRAAPDRHLFDVITHGYGVMVPYADRIEPADRWAIVAFVRALQMSQYVDAKQLPPEQRERLNAQADVQMDARAGVEAVGLPLRPQAPAAARRVLDPRASFIVGGILADRAARPGAPAGGRP